MKEWNIKIIEDDEGVFHATVNGGQELTEDPKDFDGDYFPRDAAIGEMFGVLADTFEVE